MAQPFPPQGNQKQYNEKPIKVYGEQYLEGEALPIGVRTDAPDGLTVPPYVLVKGIYFPVHLTDWIITSRYSGTLLEVLSADEAAERYGASDLEV